MAAVCSMSGLSMLLLRKCRKFSYIIIDRFSTYSVRMFHDMYMIRSKLVCFFCLGSAEVTTARATSAPVSILMVLSCISI